MLVNVSVGVEVLRVDLNPDFFCIFANQSLPQKDGVWIGSVPPVFIEAGVYHNARVYVDGNPWDGKSVPSGTVYVERWVTGGQVTLGEIVPAPTPAQA